MKHFLLSAFLVLAPLLVQAQPSQLVELSPPTVVKRGPHHRVIQQIQRFLTPSGQVVERTGSYVEIGTGLQFFDPAQNAYKDSQVTLEVFEGYAAARQGQIQATF